VLCALQLCTLSAAGGDLLNAFPAGAGPLFDVVVVDEAAQALEPATLIPLQHIKPGAGSVEQGSLHLPPASCDAWGLHDDLAAVPKPVDIAARTAQ
jgi:hypothetical protein